MSLFEKFQDFVSGEKRTHYRKVGKQTIKFCKQASKLSANKSQRRVLMCAAISADEVVSALMGLEERRDASAFKERRVRNPINGDQVPTLMRAYLSVLLVASVAFRDKLLAGTELSEAQFMAGWRSAFDYEATDIRRFDDELVPAFRAKGMDGLVEALGHVIADALFEEKGPLSSQERAFLLDMIAEDTAAIKQQAESSVGGTA